MTPAQQRGSVLRTIIRNTKGSKKFTQRPINLIKNRIPRKLRIEIRIEKHPRQLTLRDPADSLIKIIILLQDGQLVLAATSPILVGEYTRILPDLNAQVLLEKKVNLFIYGLLSCNLLRFFILYMSDLFRRLFPFDSTLILKNTNPLPQLLNLRRHVGHLIGRHTCYRCKHNRHDYQILHQFQPLFAP